MKTIYQFNKVLLLSFFMFIVIFSTTNSKVNAQGTVVTVPPINGTTTWGGITYNLQTTQSIIIDTIYINTSGIVGNTVDLEVWYNPSPINGQPLAFTGAPWINVVVSQTLPAGIDLAPIFIPGGLSVPAGSNWGFYIGDPLFSNSGLRYGSSGSVSTVTDGTVTIEMGTNVGYGWLRNTSSTSNHPRFFAGGVHYNSAVACSGSPVAGSAVAPSNVCANQNFTLSLTGQSLASGLTYQWMSSPSSTGPWTYIIGGTTLSYATSQTIDTYYACEVTCTNSSLADTSASVFVQTSPNLPAGTYTIGTSGNYPNFTSAVAAMSCGIAGPITFNVLPGSGPYNEQITIPQIINSSSTNTITFNGNGETITYASTGTGDNFIIRLDGADYITFDSLNIVTQSATNNFAVHLTNDADFNTINNCNIDLTSTLSSTVSSNAGIVVSGSLTSATTAGASGTNNTFTNNTITGGYYGITINGASSSIESLNNIISGNTIQDFYFYGAYLRSISRSTIANNDIHRINRTSVSSFYGLYFVTSGIRNTIEANKIHDAYTGVTTTSTSTSYPIYHTGVDATPGDENRVINNLIYNINNNGTVYALYNSSSDGVFYYHNTISLDDANATAGITRGFYQLTTASGIEFKNNIITITRAGTGTKHCIYFGTTTSIITSDYNVFYINAPAGTNNLGYIGSNQATLLAWQTATTGDTNSVDADPIYANILSNDLTPANAAINGIATATVGVTNDFFGISRAVTPDPGAIEFTPPTCAQPSALTTINVTATSADLGWTENGTATVWDIELGATGFIPTGVPTITGTTTNPHTINTLLAQTSYDFYVRADCGVDSSAWSGPYTFTTACAAVIAPWTENFENAGVIPACWNQGVSNNESWLFANTGSGNHIGNNGTLGGATTSGNYFAWVDDSSPHSTATTLESPFIDVTSLTNPTLKFFLISNNEGFTNVDFSVDVWDGATWNVGYYTHNTNTVNGEWEQITVNLSTLAITGDVQLRFIVDENNGTDFYDDVAIDDVQIIEATVCTAQLNLGSDTIICTPGSILLDAGTNYSDYLWSDAGASTTSSILVDSTSFGIGIHTIYVVAIDTINNCVTRDTIVVEISTCVGIDAVANSVSMKVYPNPNNGEFTLNINTTDIKELDVKVLNTQGQVVYAKNNYSNITNINDKVDLSNNANGIYFIVITTNKGIVTHKLVIQ